ncbi:MAG: chorismate mutase [Promethearchaeota archaeon]
MFKENKVFNKEVKLYRKKIDKIDNKIVKFLNKRGQLVNLLGEIKNKYKVDIYQPEREEEIIERMKIKSKVLRNTSIESIWKEIIKGCKFLQAVDIPEKKY